MAIAGRRGRLGATGNIANVFGVQRDAWAEPCPHLEAATAQAMCSLCGFASTVVCETDAGCAEDSTAHTLMCRCLCDCVFLASWSERAHGAKPSRHRVVFCTTVGVVCLGGCILCSEMRLNLIKNASVIFSHKWLCNLLFFHQIQSR